MTIEDLIDGLPIRIAQGSLATEVSDIVEDSRLAKPGCLFVARAGAKSDGRRFVADAVLAGATAVLSDELIDAAANVTTLIAEDVPLAASLLAERFCGNASSRLSLVGVTGTNGKTTTTYLIRHLLSSAGVRCGLIGTVQIDDGNQLAVANLTTPPALELSRLMRTMLDNGCGACAMEASSHALHQKRTAGLQFKIGVFTNLTGDHLDYHQTMDAYLDAKAILFESLPRDGWAILNFDDTASQKLAKRTPATVMACSVTNPHAACNATIGAQALDHIHVTFGGPWGRFACDLPLIGKHNVMNALQALAVGHAMGLTSKALRNGIATCSAPPGRLEPVTRMGDRFSVLVDYAHTDDALENVLRALRPVLPAGGKLRVVFGCGGDRDRTKRPRMASVACKLADDIIITSDNPRTEEPASIIEEIASGVPTERRGDILSMVDREHAIHAAIERTGDGDILLIAGKGHEDYQIIGTTKRPFDDRLVARDALLGRLRNRTTVAG